MNLKNTIDKTVQMETRKLLNILAVILLVGFIAVFFSGYILGSAVQQKECFEYFAWYKVVNDCDSCDKWSCRQIGEIREYLDQRR